MASNTQQPQHPECPFCQFHDESEYVLLLHIEALHTDDSPFVVKDDPANTGLTGGFTDNLGPGKFNALDYEFGGPSLDDEETTYVLCPEPGCEEPVLLMELQTHLDFHGAEQISMEDVRHYEEELGVGGRGSGSSSGRSGGGSSGDSSGDSPLGGNEREREKDMAVRRMDSVGREREGREIRDNRESKESWNGRSGSVRREKRENRTLVVSRDGTISRESLVSRDGHRERDRILVSRDGGISRESLVSRDGYRESDGQRERDWFLVSRDGHRDGQKDRDGQRERDKMLEREREKERDRERGRDKGHGSRGHRIIYADPESPSPPSSPATSTRHLQNSPKRSYRTFYGILSSDKDSSSSRKLEKSSARSSPVIPYKDGGVKRLGKSDLGPYAHELQMPGWLRKELENGGKVSTHTTIDGATGALVRNAYVSNETPDILPVIAFLCEMDSNVTRAWLCHPGVKHIGKQIPGEGGFCGYRNIQMMISYVQAAFRSHPFGGCIPSILKLQDWIEEGWDKGINVNARLETGGIKGTRKYIGTSEAQTMFTSLGIPCCPHPFNRSDGLQTQHRLLDFVEHYFRGSVPEGPLSPKVSRTHKPPIYFQHSGHSMTIVGIERTLDGMRNLLVFDPFFTPSVPMKNLIGLRLKGRLDSGMLLRAYRRKMNYLRKYKEFELIVLEV